MTLDVAADPTVGDACACDCTVTQPPSCVTQTLNHNYDTTNACSNGGTPVVVDGGCVQVGDVDSGGINLYPYWMVFPLPETASGACTGKPASDPAAASSTPSRLCIDPTCKTTCSAAPGFSACFFASGDVPCPTGLSAHKVGTVSVKCGSCTGCSADVPDGGCQGSVSLYADTACMSLLATIGVDGGCGPNAGNGSIALSVKYDPTDVGTVCKPGTSSGTVSLEQELTVCCP